MVWRATVVEARHPDGRSRKQAMKRRIDAGTPVGLLGHLDGVPVAWCSIAPRSTYRAGLGSVREDDAKENVWSLACFFVKREYRGKGAFRALLDAARAHAKAHRWRWLIKDSERVVRAHPKRQIR